MGGGGGGEQCLLFRHLFGVLVVIRPHGEEKNKEREKKGGKQGHRHRRKSSFRAKVGSERGLLTGGCPGRGDAVSSPVRAHVIVTHFGCAPTISTLSCIPSTQGPQMSSTSSRLQGNLFTDVQYSSVAVSHCALAKVAPAATAMAKMTHVRNSFLILSKHKHGKWRSGKKETHNNPHTRLSRPLGAGGNRCSSVCQSSSHHGDRMESCPLSQACQAWEGNASGERRSIIQLQ